MDGKKKKNQVIRAVIVYIIYFVFAYFSSSWFQNHGVFVSINKINNHNIIMRLFDDLLFTIIPLLTVIKMWKHKKEYNLLVGDNTVSILCGICFLFIFVSQKNFSLAEIYRAFFYLIFTAGCEECFFRGYLYHSFLPMNKVFAIILSGMLWGSVHAIMPAIFNGLNLSEMLISIFNYIGGGIVVGYFYIYLQEKSNGIIVPILLHTVSDYGHGYIGPLFFAGIIIWYMYKTKRTCKKLRGKKS